MNLYNILTTLTHGYTIKKSANVYNFEYPGGKSAIVFKRLEQIGLLTLEMS